MIKNNKGFTLIELLLSMVFGLIVLAGVIYVYVAVIGSTATTLKTSKLNTQLMTIMSVVTGDIRRAGFWAETGSLASENVFNQQGDTAIEAFKSDNTVVSENTNVDGSCIVYAYDKDEDGELDDDEYSGFRLNGQILEMLTTPSVTKGDNCNTGGWETLSEPRIYKIKSFTVNPQNSACVNSNEPDGLDDDGANGVDDDDERDCYSITPNTGDITVETREFIISITGELTDDSFITHSLTQNVRVRNDLVRAR
ncbi:prepilin-type N-terminal cleavage/methylation domain-containing protein [Thalassotalea nanhaiensis]|uniref:Prepilin-type N-terminal cleavage/methylation domain-containing protein n=1 Tax=Thalassotalea nanhaiensis TaxID=3065648 RepID=A0ABY9TGQ2_9GAMM|nr:prepilin-type N-terminal cleavage/methylation domain-containing protein [Colwelliaceae bacterium SQ345]